MSKYFVSFKVIYTNNKIDLDATVDWDGLDIPSLKHKLYEQFKEIITKYLKEKEPEAVCICINSIFKLKDSSNHVLIEEVCTKSGFDNIYVVKCMGSESECRTSMEHIYNLHPFNSKWSDVSSLSTWCYIDEEDKALHKFRLLVREGSSDEA